MAFLPNFKPENYTPANDPLLDFPIGHFNVLGPLFADSNGGNPPFGPTAPVDILGNNPNFVASTITALKYSPGLRIGIHPEWFDVNGEMPPAIQQVFLDFAAAGMQFIWMYASHSSANPPTTGTNDEKIQSLRDVMLARSLETFAKLRVYLDRYPALRNATVALELFNEPAVFRNLSLQPEVAADPVYGQPYYLPHMYADFCIEVYRSVKDWWPGQVHVGGYRYSAEFNDLLVKNPNGETVIDRIRATIGARRLVWTWHSYVSWHVGVDSYAEMVGRYFTSLGPVMSDRIFASETNVSGATVGDVRLEGVTTFDRVIQDFMKSWRWLRQRGVGTGYFPPFNTGSSHLLSFTPEGAVTVNHPTGLAEANYMWLSRADQPAATTLFNASFLADWGDLAGVARTTEIATQGAIVVSAANGSASGVTGRLNMIYGGSGNNTLAGATDVRNFIYGVTGNNSITAQGAADWVRGGDGTDTITSTADFVFVDGGVGPSNISIQAGQSFLLLGTGTNAVTIAANIGPHTVFDLGEGDSILLNGWGSVTYLQNGADVDVSSAGGSLTVKDASTAYVQARVTAT